MKEHRNSNIHLRPRFNIEVNESSHILLSKFKKYFNNAACHYCGKIVDCHIVIDVPKEENHFWSPQLNIEIESLSENTSIVTGLFGPKPQVWTLFMFIHFVMGIFFLGFLIASYVQNTLKSDAFFANFMIVLLPVLWVAMYFLGRLGRRKGHRQMDELHTLMFEILEKDKDFGI